MHSRSYTIAVAAALAALLVACTGETSTIEVDADQGADEETDVAIAPAPVEAQGIRFDAPPRTPRCPTLADIQTCSGTL